MIKTISKTILVFAGLLLVLVSSISALAETSLPSPTNQFFVNDFAGVLSSDSISEMQKKGESLYHKTKAQAVVATVDNMGGDNIEHYSIELAEEWGIGDEKEDNGVLLLLAVEERKIRIEVGSGLEGALTDTECDLIIDTYGMEHLSNDDFSTGLSKIYNAIVNEIYIEYDIEPSDDYTPVDELEDDEALFEIGRIVLIIIIVILASIWSSRRRGGPGGPGPHFLFFGGGHGGYRGGGFHGGSGGFSGGGFSGGGGGFSGGGSSRGF